MNILTLEQVQNMSEEEIINAYNNGYRLSDTTNIHHQSGHTILSSQLTSSDINALITANVASNLITVGLFGLMIYYIIKKEREAFVTEIKQTLTSSIQTSMVKLPALLRELREVGILKKES